MSGSSFLAVFLATLMRLGSAELLSGLHFVESPMNVTSSLGKPVAVRCVLRADGEGQGPLDVLWLKEGQPLDFADTNQMQFPEDENGWLVISKLKIEELQLSDMGSYQCAVFSGEDEILSIEGYIELEGLPHFSVEPQHRSVVANEELSLRCVAHGPPDPVRVIWLQDGSPLNNLDDPISLSPSTLDISGLNKTSSFSCEAHNRKGVASSGSGVVTVLPCQPRNIKAEEITNSSVWDFQGPTRAHRTPPAPLLALPFSQFLQSIPPETHKIEPESYSQYALEHFAGQQPSESKIQAWLDKQGWTSNIPQASVILKQG